MAGRGSKTRATQDESPAEQIERLRRENAALRRELSDMRGLALRDQLTGLYSRRYLTDYLQHEIAADDEGPTISLALCDIDDFKTINDRHGHRAGDIAIVCIADILDDLADGQPVIRWGGEELLIVLFGTDEPEALRLCESMRHQVERYRMNDGRTEFSCTLTFGVGAYDRRLTFAENFACIDRALYRGKDGGKNRSVVALGTPGVVALGTPGGEAMA